MTNSRSNEQIVSEAVDSIHLSDWDDAQALCFKSVTAAVPDAATRHACSDTEFHQYLVENLPEDEASRRELAAALRGAEGERDSYKQERDAALAAVKRVRDILNRDDFGDDWEHDEWVYRQAAENQLADIEAALDGAPEPEVKP